MEREKNATRLAQSASALGAGILGFGIGVKWGSKLIDYAIAIVIIGAIFHVAGMYVMQLSNKPERYNAVAKLLWISAWVCLIAIIALFLIFAFA